MKKGKQNKNNAIRRSQEEGDAPDLKQEEFGSECQSERMMDELRVTGKRNRSERDGPPYPPGTDIIINIRQLILQRGNPVALYARGWNGWKMYFAMSGYEPVVFRDGDIGVIQAASKPSWPTTLFVTQSDLRNERILARTVSEDERWKRFYH